MPFAVELFLDPTSDAAVRRLWQDLAEADMAPAIHVGGLQPHVTLAACDRLDVDACERFLADFAATTPAPTTRFASLGVFPTDPAVAFLAPVVTPDLLDLHDRILRRFRELADEPWAYYVSGQWVPHCTLALELPLATVPRAVELCRGVPLPLEGRLDGVSIVEFPPIRHRRAFRFGDG
jgi:2'-5' RNA ligase